MGTKLFAIILIACISSLTHLQVGSGRIWTAGVIEGDFLYYKTYGVFKSSQPDFPFNIPAFEQNNTEFVRIDIIKVAGSDVHQRYTLHFNDGTEINSDLKTNLDPVTAGDFKFNEKGIPICAANMDLGDPLATLQLRVNQTFKKTYPSGEERETNRVLWNFPEDWGHCDFDKKTGVLVELNRVHMFINPSSGSVVTKTDVIILTNSSLWPIDSLHESSL